MSKYGNRQGTTLVLGGTGRTGQRVTERLRARGLLARAAAQRALGREPRDLGDRARRTAAAGVRDGGR